MFLLMLLLKPRNKQKQTLLVAVVEARADEEGCLTRAGPES